MLTDKVNDNDKIGDKVNDNDKIGDKVNDNDKIGDKVNDKVTETKTYTFFSDVTDYNNGTQNKIIYQIPINGVENNEWKKVTEIKSLKTAFAHSPYWKCNVESDKLHNVECLDWNFTHLRLRLSYDKAIIDNKYIPLKHYDSEKEITDKSDIIELTSLSRSKDIWVDNMYYEKIHFGENSTVVSLNITSGDGYVYSYDNSNWDNAHDDGDGKDAKPSDSDIRVWSYEDTTRDPRYYIYRGFLPFNTSSVPDDCTIDSALISLYTFTGAFGLVNDDNDGDDFVVIVGNTTQANYSTLTISDFNESGSVDSPTEMSTRYDLSTQTDDARHSFVLNQAGFDAINKIGMSLYGIREGHDVVDSAIAVDSKNAVTYYSGEGGIIGNKVPYINITYTLGNPNITTPVVNNNASGSYVYSVDELNCSVTVTDISNSTLTTEFTWYNDTGIVSSENKSCTSGVVCYSSAFTNLVHFSNYTCSVRCWDGTYWSDTDNSTEQYINNSIPAMTNVELNKTSGVIDTDSLLCNATGLEDDDVIDSLSYHYEWYNNTVAMGIDDSIISSGNLTTNETWYCEAWGTDGYVNTSKYTSTSVTIGSSAVAPSISTFTLTTNFTGVLSNSTSPTNNDSWINMTINFTDPNTNNWSIYFCDTPTFSDCKANATGELLCKKETDDSTSNVSCKYNTMGYTGTNPDTLYGFVEDNSSLVSTGKSSTFEINYPPTEAVLVSPVNGSYINTNYTVLDWSASDSDSDDITYYLYINDSTSFSLNYSGLTSSYNYTYAITEDNVYYWSVATVDEHGYFGDNVSLGWFTTDWTQPSLSITSPTSGQVFNSKTLSVTNAASDTNSIECNLTVYQTALGLGSPETGYDNISVNCDDSKSITVSAWTDYTAVIYITDVAGNIDTVNVSFTTRQASSDTTSSGGGSALSIADTKDYCNITITPSNVTFFKNDKVINIEIVNNENFSVSPSYTLDTTLFDVRGAESVLLGNDTSDFTLQRLYDGNESINELITISSPECKDITMSVSYVSGQEIVFDIIMFFKNIEEKTLKTLLSRINIFGVSVNFFYLTIVSIILVGLLMMFATTKLSVKIASGLFIVIIMNMIMGFTLKPIEEVDIGDNRTSIVDITINNTNEVSSYMTEIINTEITRTNVVGENVSVTILWLIIAVLLMMTGAVALIKGIPWWLKVPVIITVTLLVAIAVYYFKLKLGGF